MDRNLLHEERLYQLCQISQEKCQETCDGFETHFLWLKETLAAARKTISSEQPSLLPKTPSVKRNASKKPTASVTAEDNTPQELKRTSVDNNDDGDQKEEEDDTNNVTPPRRGRAASKLAMMKVKNNLGQKLNRKMRRPSTPEQTTTFTTVKKRGGSRRAVNNRSESKETEKVSPESQICDVKVNRKDVVEQQEETPPQISTPASSTTDDVKTPTKTSINTNHCISVNLNRERLSTQSTTITTTQDIDTDNRVPTRTSPVVLIEKVDSCNSSHLTDAENKSSQNTTQVTVANAIVVKSTQSNQKENIDTSNLSLRLEESDDENEIPRSQENVKNKEKVNKIMPLPAISPEVKTQCMDVVDKSSSVKSMDEDECEIPNTPVPKPRVTRTKQKALQCFKPLIDVSDSDNDEDYVKQPVAKPRTTRTKQKVITTTQMPPPPPTDITTTRVTRTKQKKKELVECNEPEVIDNQSEEKEEEVEVIEVPKPISTHTKKKSFETNVVNSTSVIQIFAAPHNTRTTRTKKRPVEVVEEQFISSSSTKRKKTDEGVDPEERLPVDKADSPDTKKGRHYDSHDSVSSSGVSSVKSITSEITVGCFTEAPQPQPQQQPVTRITRSKMRQVHPIKKSPVKASPHQSPKPSTQTRFNHIKDSSGSPKLFHGQGRTGRSPLRFSPRPNIKYSGMGRGTATHTDTPVDMVTEVEELTNEDVEVIRSPARVTRHSGNKGLKNEERQKGGARFSPVHIEKKGLGLHHLTNTGSSTYTSSGGITPTPRMFSRLQFGLGLTSSSSSSSELHKTTKTFGTPNEVRRPMNIIAGVSSFIKVQAIKPTREELEEKRQQELQRKREKAEDTMKKKEELLKAKTEEKKRLNDERMRRVQEAREERERKALEVKEQQECERRQREERQREEQHRKKQQLLAKKRAEEEAKALKIREQQEEERRRREEEKRKQIEEEKRLEEVKRYEEERRARLAEQKRLQEEDKRRKAEEAERMAREKRELERLKQEEIQRKAAASPVRKAVLNNTYNAGGDDKENNTTNTALNTTYTNTGLNTTYTNNTGLNTTYTNTKQTADSYVMTPQNKKKKKTVKNNNANDYNINDLKSDDSTDNDSSPKKKIPAWAMKSQLNSALIQQEYYPPPLDDIFIPEELLQAPNLTDMFPIKRKRFTKRTSSAVWNTPPAKLFH
ncbi:hypothetical protein Pmani_036016 [Petrolisthes manimaculis]|uniref:Inner centromere protein ARK-binding domain-containing protein n=1 Tax=Petrolisthes manimaculis TaxID=1843537 RepID=A0AAE1NL17_9EUCA|nr:hypothetical protein Pmani_036016 [Petrolisthes manimaculis]